MKNIIILDVYANYIQSVLATGEINISMAMVDSKYVVDKCKEKFGDKIQNYYYRIPITNEEFDELNKSDYNLTYKDIEKYRATQLKCEHYLHREIKDIGVMQYRYLMALRFWLGFFKKNKIDFVFAGHIEHGGIWDTIPIDIAKQKGIPVYSMSITSSNDIHEVNCITKLNDNSFVDLSDLELTKVDFNEYMENLEKTTVVLQKPKINWFKKLKKIWAQFIRFLKFLIYSVSSPYRKYKLRTRKYVIWGYLPKDELFRGSLYVRGLKQVYNKISEQPVKGEKYIYIPLHMEPEASIMARAILNCQIYIVKLVSELLPSDWKVYVKDHPAQMHIYDSADYFYRNLEFFRTYDFYHEIKKLKNVRIIDIKYPQPLLIENAQAVASITGSALVQSVLKNKPIIVFGKSLNCVELLKDTFLSSSSDNLKQAIAKIEGNFKPDYSDFSEVVEKYAFLIKTYLKLHFKDEDKDMVSILKKLVQLS